MRLQSLTLAGTLAIGCADPLQPNLPIPFDGGSEGGPTSFDVSPVLFPDVFIGDRENPRNMGVDVHRDIPLVEACVPSTCTGGVILPDRVEFDVSGGRQELCVRFPERSVMQGLLSSGENSNVLVFALDSDRLPNDVLLLKRTVSPELFQNVGGTFTNVTARFGLNTVPASVAAAAGDYDGDGDQDLFFAGPNGNVLFQNNGGLFVRVPDALRSEDALLRGTAAVFVEPYLLFGTDNGTRAYRYEGGHFVEATHDSGLEDQPGEAADFAVTRYGFGGRNHIYISNPTGRNRHFVENSNGHYTSVELTDGTVASGATLDAEWVTYQEEINPSLSVVTYNERLSPGAANFFFVQNPDGTFSDRASALAIRDPGRTTRVVWGDFLGDQRPWQFLGRAQQPNLLYIPRLHIPDRVVERFEDHALPLGMDRIDGHTVSVTGARVFDYDNDGKSDLLFVFNNGSGLGGLKLFHNDIQRVRGCNSEEDR